MWGWQPYILKNTTEEGVYPSMDSFLAKSDGTLGLNFGAFSLLLANPSYRSQELLVPSPVLMSALK